jgi:hypothetical protein
MADHKTAEQHAKAFLEEKKIPVKKVIQVLPDAILYVNAADNAWTCWLTYDEETNTLHHEVEKGFPLARSPY